MGLLEIFTKLEINTENFKKINKNLSIKVIPLHVNTFFKGNIFYKTK